MGVLLTFWPPKIVWKGVAAPQSGFLWSDSCRGFRPPLVAGWQQQVEGEASLFAVSLVALDPGGSKIWTRKNGGAWSLAKDWAKGHRCALDWPLCWRGHWVGRLWWPWTATGDHSGWAVKMWEKWRYRRRNVDDPRQGCAGWVLQLVDVPGLRRWNGPCAFLRPTVGPVPGPNTISTPATCWCFQAAAGRLSFATELAHCGAEAGNHPVAEVFGAARSWTWASPRSRWRWPWSYSSCRDRRAWHPRPGSGFGVRRCPKDRSWWSTKGHRWTWVKKKEKGGRRWWELWERATTEGCRPFAPSFGTLGPEDDPGQEEKEEAQGEESIKLGKWVVWSFRLAFSTSRPASRHREDPQAARGAAGSISQPHPPEVPRDLGKDGR